MANSDQPATLGVAAFAPKIHGAIRLAKAADNAGIETIWMPELYNQSSTIPVAAMAVETKQTRVATGIAYGVGRSPLTLTAEARDLDELSNGRFTLGLGNGTAGMIEHWHGLDPSAPAVRMEELVTLLRKLWPMNDAVKHDGRFYRMNFRPIEETPPPTTAHLPIYTAGVNPRMVETAGRVADGIIGHPILSKKYLEEIVRPAVAKGAEHAGRSPDDIAIASMVICVINDDEEMARNEVARQIAFYGSVKTYGRMLDMCGFGAEAAKINEAMQARDLPGMVKAVSDDMIDAMSVTGSAEQVREGLRSYDGVLDHIIIYSPTHQIASERIEENIDSLINMVKDMPE